MNIKQLLPTPFTLFVLSLSISPVVFAAGESPSLTNGKKLYDTNCSMCHGANGNGKGRAAAVITSGPKPRDFTLGKFKYGSDQKSIITTIKKGVKDTAMPAWEGQIKEQDYLGLVSYIKAFHQK